MKEDISSHCAGGVWPLSSYTPSPLNCQSLPGSEDFSQEEIRWKFYVARAHGKFETYVSTVPDFIRYLAVIRSDYVCMYTVESLFSGHSI